jgi:hypothetical protein
MEALEPGALELTGRSDAFFGAAFIFPGFSRAGGLAALFVFFFAGLAVFRGLRVCFQLFFFGGIPFI